MLHFVDRFNCVAAEYPPDYSTFFVNTKCVCAGYVCSRIIPVGREKIMTIKFTKTSRFNLWSPADAVFRFAQNNCGGDLIYSPSEMKTNNLP